LASLCCLASEAPRLAAAALGVVGSLTVLRRSANSAEALLSTCGSPVLAAVPARLAATAGRFGLGARRLTGLAGRLAHTPGLACLVADLGCGWACPLGFAVAGGRVRASAAACAPLRCTGPFGSWTVFGFVPGANSEATVPEQRTLEARRGGPAMGCVCGLSGTWRLRSSGGRYGAAAGGAIGLAPIGTAAWATFA
jgi:hypothetical protein